MVWRTKWSTNSHIFHKTEFTVSCKTLYLSDKDDIILQLCYSHSRNLNCQLVMRPQQILPSFWHHITFSFCLANPRYHSTDAIWEQTPTTRAPARHLQYHALIVDSVNWIHRIYCLEDMCLLCICGWFILMRLMCPCTYYWLAWIFVA